MLNKRVRRCFALLLAVLLLLGSTPAALAEGSSTVSVSSAEELLRVVKQCALDSWSRGRTVVLTADIDLKGESFTPFPTFGGVFDGQGHTISGLRVAESGSSMGLFRTLQEGAVVRDLTVAGTVAPSGSAAQVGGIVGINHGSVQSCTFRGIVQGDSQVGGIAGWNRESGEVSGCTVEGQITGSGSAGGIAGQNEGLLMKCTNSAEVNTHSPDTSVQVQDLDVSLEQIGSSEDAVSSEGLLSSSSDTGGIAGLSLGVIQSCINNGSVGYPHVGYNVGGIAGRQSGSITGCINNGAVRGRKDVGGIAGQAEPDISVLPGAQTLEQLRQELSQLQNLVDQSVSSADAQGDRISSVLSAIGGYTDAAKDNTNALLDQTSAFVDGNIQQINTLSAAVTDALDRLSPALDALANTSGLIDDVCGQLEEAVEALHDAGSITQEAADIAKGALDRLQGAGVDIAEAVEAMRAAAQRLQDGVIHRDSELERQALADLSAAMNRFADGVFAASSALSDMKDAVHSGIFNLDAIRQLLSSLVTISESARETAKNILLLIQNTDFNWDALQGGIASAGIALDGLHNAALAFAAAMDALRAAAGETGGLSGPMETMRNALLGALDTGDAIGSGLERAFAGMQNAVDTLRRNGGISFVSLGEAFHDASSGLYAAAGGLSQEMENLHANVDSARGDLAGNLQAINRQTGVVTGLLLDAMTDLQSGSDTDLITDASDEDIAAVQQGKIAQCVNNGSVEGDRNVGGAAGAMAIDYDLDPEDDIQRLSLGATYETRAVLYGNINRGTVIGKKDCVGGMVGRMDLGAVVGCESYSDVSSSSGGYVGGIAGWSESTVRECSAKCVLSGGDDVGGIAGWATRLRDCQSIATIESGRSRTGAVAGNADVEGGGISGNRFVDTGTAGIDGVSYAGVAEPVSFETLRGDPGVPVELTSFTLKLVADGEVLARIPFQYGQDLSGLTLPEVPEQEGSYGRWPEFDTTGLVSDITLEAVYTPWSTLVGSAETNGENGPSLALAEGQFTQDALLQVRVTNQTPPAGGEEVWKLTLTGAGLPSKAQVPIRLLDRYGGGTVWQYTNGRWQSMDAETNGQYLLLQMDGLEGVFSVVPGGNIFSAYLLPGAAAAGAAVLLILFGKHLGTKKAAKKAAAKAAAEESEER